MTRHSLLAGAFSLILVVAACAGDDASSFSGDEAEAGGRGDRPETGEVADESIEGRWVLESWWEDDRRIAVEVGVNTPSEAWIDFTKTFEGVRDSFISADSTGTAGTFMGSTGCNDIRETGYEFSVGFLLLEEAVVQAVECEPGRAEEVVLAMLGNTPDGIEVVMGVGQMELFGSNLHGTVYPLMFRRDG